MAFFLALYPWVYKAKYKEGTWAEEYEEKHHLSPEEENALSVEERSKLLDRRNSFPDLPLVNYTTQYAMGCFEGQKAFPQKNGGLKVFRPDENAARMTRSMEGLGMPGIDPGLLEPAMMEVVARNVATGFTIEYNPAWEEEHFVNGSAVYIRPFAYSEPAIGINFSFSPWVIVICTPVSAYFSAGSRAAVTSDMIRATPNGTGWIKCAANYVVSALAKKKAEKEGYMEAIFLDGVKREFIEEGSSCNFFCLLKDGTLVTPALGDTILPGISRKSVLQLAADMGVKTEERPLSIHEVLDNGEECFVTGTAAGVSPLDSMTHQGKRSTFFGGSMGPLTRELMSTLKGIQYGAIEDKYNWMKPVDPTPFIK